MSTVNVVVPWNDQLDQVREGWEYPISALLDAGSDVLLVDENGIERNCRYGIFRSSGAAGAVKCRGVNQSDAQATLKTIVAGGYISTMRASFFYSASTATGLDLHVRL